MCETSVRAVITRLYVRQITIECDAALIAGRIGPGSRTKGAWFVRLEGAMRLELIHKTLTFADSVPGAGQPIPLRLPVESV